MPSFCSMLTQCASLHAPSEPSALTRNFGTMNRLMPFTPSGARDAREHKMDDVLRHVVFAVRDDEDLRAEELERPVRSRLGARAHQPENRASLRFGQIHPAGPFPRDHLRD